MSVALLNAHTQYSPGVAWTFGGQLYNEYILSSRINRDIKKVLNQHDVDSYIVDSSKVKPYSKSLNYKAYFVNLEGADIAIETHFNSSSLLKNKVSGMEVLYHAPRDNSLELAKTLVTSMKHYLPFKLRRGNGLYPRTKIYLLRTIECPTILIEVCFLSNPVDRLFLLHANAISVIANCISNGILTYL